MRKYHEIPYYEVSAEQYRSIDSWMSEIKRRLRRTSGSPLDPERLLLTLQGLAPAISNHAPQYGAGEQTDQRSEHSSVTSQ